MSSPSRPPITAIVPATLRLPVNEPLVDTDPLGVTGKMVSLIFADKESRAWSVSGRLDQIVRVYGVTFLVVDGLTLQGRVRNLGRRWISVDDVIELYLLDEYTKP